MQAPHSVHGINSVYLTVSATDGYGFDLDAFTEFTSSVDPSSYAVSVTFVQAFTGTLNISGPWPGSDTGTGFTPKVFTDTRVFGMRRLALPKDNRMPALGGRRLVVHLLAEHRAGRDNHRVSLHS